MGEPTKSPRQTLSYLRGLLTQHHIRPKNKLGQNFLIDLNLLDMIVRAAELAPDDLVLEVGSGTGSLTAQLAARAAAVLTVEIDESFHALAREVVGPLPNVTFLRTDVLRRKNELHPSVVAAVEELRQAHPGGQLKLVANLPYAVAVPVISNCTLTDWPIERFVVMVQWEIAARLLAEPGTKDYGALAVLIQSLADVELIRKIPPTAFWPRPKVDSAVVRIRPRADKRATVGDPVRLRNFLRELYVHRRKNLRGALSSLPRGRMEKAEVDRLLGELQLEGTGRAEDLDLQQHLRLCAVFG